MGNGNERASPPDFDGAIGYALERLRSELSPELSYHSTWHTESDVLPAARRLARAAGLSQFEARLLEVAAAFHDLGHIRTWQGHEDIGIEIMAAVLPKYGFANEEIVRLSAMIRATRMPQSPHNELECLLADADLDSLGRDDFIETSTALWRELEHIGRVHTWADWLHMQLNFLRSHCYFTAVARELRDEGKRRNIAELERLLRQA